MTPNARPRSLAVQTSIQQVGSELLIYDERRHQAFCLNATSAAIWKLCDGRRTIAQIAAAAQADGLAAVTEEVVLLAVNQLYADGLVADDTPWIPIPEVSRRVMMQRLATGAAILLPGVAMVMAPKAAQAYNGCVNCGTNAVTAQDVARRKQQWQIEQAKAKAAADAASGETAGQLFKP